MHRLGQSFLKDNKATARIVAALGAQKGDVVVEIGPGHGELTRLLIDGPAKKVIAIERDTELAQALSAAGLPRLEVITGDAREDLARIATRLSDHPWRLIGNIPYYITGIIFRELSELAHPPECAVFTIQKEVAERLTSRAPHFNRLAAASAAWAETSLLLRLPARLFSPRPKVDSAVVLLSRRSHPVRLKDTVLQGVFKQPRKTILNNLSDSLPLAKDELSRLLAARNIAPTARPGDLDLESLIRISELWD